MSNELIKVTQLVEQQHLKTKGWHNETPQVSGQGFLALVEENHRFNFLLWHDEDKARREDKGFEYVYKAKRNIDHYNQQRNNFIEKMDAWIVEHYQPASNGCPFNSETPGMMIDRLSILSLKHYHMQLQTIRDDVSDEHCEKCQQKLTVISQQSQHLTQALTELLQDVSKKTRSFHLYHQFKMYNDPKLNPQLYRNKANVEN